MATRPGRKHKKARARTETLYLIRAKGINASKIGIASDLTNRIASLQTASPVDIEVILTIQSPHAAANERCLHEKFSKYRLRGEWFSFDDATLERVMADYADIALNSSQYWSAEQLGAYLQYSAAYIWNLAQRGAIPHHFGAYDYDEVKRALYHPVRKDDEPEPLLA